jgi:branched-chain amino acid transport system ATP-binding protein
MFISARAATGDAMLEVNKLNAGYDSMQVLWSPSLRVAEGSITSLLGPNGVGKSTLLRSIMGWTRITAGSVSYLGLDVTRVPSHEKVERGLTLVPEGKHLFADMSVAENLALGTYPRRARGEMSAAYEQVFAMFPILAERRAQRAGSLSGGQQQMVTIGRALMTRPKLLMLDEPSQGLSPKLVGEMFETIARLRDEAGLTILLVDQNATATLQTADYAYVMHEGTIDLEGPAKELATREEIRAAYLGM